MWWHHLTYQPLLSYTIFRREINGLSKQFSTFTAEYEG